MAIEKTHLYKVDLARALTKTAINAVFSTDNKQADVFVLDVVRNGHLEDLSNVVVTGTFVCHSNDITVPVIMGGRVEENKAILTLSDGCYLASGLCTISIHLSIGEKLSTIFIGTLLMNQTATDTVLDPDNVIPSIGELLAQIEAIRQATKNSEEATEAANEGARLAGDATQNANRAAENANEIAQNVKDQLEAGEFKGEKGDTGSTPNITFHVATGEPGTQVQIEQSGTAENPVLSLTIPRGDTGAVDGIDYYSGDPLPLGEANSGTANGVARGDHVHPMPTAAQVGALSAANILEKTYPVGAVYISSKSTSPASLFGGTWTQIKDRFLLAAGDIYAAGSTGGEAAHTLTISEMPDHRHPSGTRNLTGTIGYHASNEAENGTGAAFALEYKTISDRTDLNIHVEPQGGGQAHNNMPPYKAYYAWERIA